MQLTVTRTFAVAELGTIAFIDVESIPLAAGSRHLCRITRPDGDWVEAVASVESVRAHSTDTEFPALLFPSLSWGAIVLGSSVAILAEERQFEHRSGPI